ncbi:MAG: hypothetical protein RLZZ458_3316 [Planctomycetota bacterium]
MRLCHVILVELDSVAGLSGSSLQPGAEVAVISGWLLLRAASMA